MDSNEYPHPWEQDQALTALKVTIAIAGGIIIVAALASRIMKKNSK